VLYQISLVFDLVYPGEFHDCVAYVPAMLY